MYPLCFFPDPTEKAVIAKERSSGSYRLSAYFVSKAVADLPLNFALPTLMYLVFFTASGIGGIVEFIATYPIVLLQVLVSQVRTLFLPFSIFFFFQLSKNEW